MMACPLGALLSGYILDKFGRKYTLVFINITAIISWGILATASKTDPTLLYYQLLIGRFIIGITTGLSSSPAAVYSAEIASPKLRGRLMLLTSMAIAMGILLIYSLGYFISENWRLTSLICCVIAIFCMIVLFPLPETPSWLIMKGRHEEARLSLQLFRGFSAADMVQQSKLNKEIEQMTEQINKKREGTNESFIHQLKYPEVYKPLAIMIGFFAFQQFSGIFVVVVYAAKFCHESGVTMDVFLCTVFIGLSRVLATVIVGVILDYLGRKPPTYFSGFGMAFCMFGLAINSWMKWTTSWLAVFFILTHISVSTIGFLTMPFTMIGELYPLKVRGLAAGLTVCVVYTMSFFTIKLYPTMVTVFGNEMVLIFYGIVSLVGIVYVWIFVPETKGKTLQEIEEYFKGKPTGLDAET